MKVGIIGGGIMGISLGYYLAQRDIKVEIFEASPLLGGLAGPITLEDGTLIDRFYHAILSSDNNLRELCEELAIDDQLRFRQTRMGFFYKGGIYSMNNMIDFLRFPPLGWLDRFRLGVTVLYAQFVRDWKSLENIKVEDWLVRLGGRRAYENIWLPMLKAKFDGELDRTPATYIWSRLVRMKSTRKGANQKEEAGHLIGGYISLIEAMAKKIESLGGKIHLKKPVSKITIENNKACGIVVNEELRTFDFIVSTLQPPIFNRMIPDANEEYRSFLSNTEYLGIVCPIMILDRPLSNYWTLNLTDDRIPFTGVIETTSYIDSKYVGGHYLIYLPKYTQPNSPIQRMTDEEIKSLWLKNIKEMFPDFQTDWVRYFLIHRERFVEPLHFLNETDLIPSLKTPIEDLFLVTNSQIYPTLTNGESVTRKAKEAASILLSEINVSETFKTVS